MGNALGGRRKSVKVMKITGETIKLKTPVRAGAVLSSHPGLVLLESEAVKHYGARAKPLEPQMELKPKRLYFLVELPKFPEDKGARRVRSGIQMNAKDRLESMMLARRSASDLTIMRPKSIAEEEKVVESNGGVRVTMRLRKSEVERLMKESKDGAEAAERIVGLCIANGDGGGGKAEKSVQWSGDLGNGVGGGAVGSRDGGRAGRNVHWSGDLGGTDENRGGGRARRNVHWSGDLGLGGGGMASGGPRLREKRVGFSPIITAEEIQLAVS